MFTARNIIHKLSVHVQITYSLYTLFIPQLLSSGYLHHDIKAKLMLVQILKTEVGIKCVIIRLKL